jgi:hypothetical protein
MTHCCSSMPFLKKQQELRKFLWQLINLTKCSIIFSNSTPQVIQTEIPSVLNVVNQEFEEKYMGIPTREGNMHKGRFMNLQSRLCQVANTLWHGVIYFLGVQEKS